MNLQVSSISQKNFIMAQKPWQMWISRVSQGEFCLGDRAFGGGEDNALSHSQWNDGVHWRTGASG